jgi:hypothetical protein
MINSTKTSRIMKPLSAVVFAVAFGLMIYGLVTPGARWLLSFGFVLTISVAFSSLGFWATQDLDKECPDAVGCPPAPNVMLPRRSNHAA